MIILNNTAGENNRRAKLTNQQVIEIRRLCDAGVPVAEIARKYNMTPRNILKIGRRQAWRSVPDVQA